jgi:hypothetical protein
MRNSTGTPFVTSTPPDFPTDTNGFVDFPTGFANNAALTLRLAPTGFQLVPWPKQAISPIVWSPVPFCIYRAPVKGGATPLQLPASAVVDLEWSDIGVNATGTVPTGSDLTVMFAPNGAVDSVYVGTTSTPVVQPIFLLLGKRERVPPGTYVAADPATWANWQDLGNLWVVINPQTGLVTTGEVAATGITTPATGVPAARGLAVDAQSMGGK